MTCERVREQIPECLAGRLEKAARESLVEHLETCSGCRNELAELGIVWRGLEGMSAPEPDRAMRTRFMEMLSAYQAGLEQAPARRPARGTREESGRGRWFAWWPSNPAWQLAIAAVLLIAGIVAGRYVGAPHEMSPEMAQLKGQVEGLRQRLRQEHLFAVLRIAPDEPPRHLPPRDGAYLADRFRRELGVAQD